MRVLKSSKDSYAPPHAVAAPRIGGLDVRNIQHNLTRSPQKPVVPQLHDHGHLAVELDALEGHSSPMSFQRVIPPTSGSFLESVGDRRPVVLVLELFC